MKIMMFHLAYLMASCFTFSICAGNSEGFRNRRTDLIPISIICQLCNLEPATYSMGSSAF